MHGICGYCFLTQLTLTRFASPKAAEKICLRHLHCPCYICSRRQLFTGGKMVNKLDLTLSIAAYNCISINKCQCPYILNNFWPEMELKLRTISGPARFAAGVFAENKDDNRVESISAEQRCWTACTLRKHSNIEKFPLEKEIYLMSPRHLVSQILYTKY